MPLYEFRCSEGTVSEAQFPMAAIPEQVDCPQCGGLATRRISAPKLSVANTAGFQLIDSTKRSAYEPEVVTSIPGAGRRRGARYTSHPLHRKLPRQ